MIAIWKFPKQLVPKPSGHSAVSAPVQVVHLDKTQHEVLAEEYMETGDSDHPTPKHGTSGQAHACWHHSISDQEAAIICAAPFSVMCAHGRYDLVAPLKTGEVRCQDFSIQT